MNDEFEKMVLHMYSVEKLTMRQIWKRLGTGRDRICRIIRGADVPVRKRGTGESIIDKYRGIIGEWYKQHPYLKAKQIYERLKEYGYTGGYGIVAQHTAKYRIKKAEAYHALTFLPGEEGQVDWFIVKDKVLGILYGFVMVLSYSRYAWGKFYRKSSYEFFIDGHKECFSEFKGIPHKCRYDNIKSVIISRYPEIRYNPQFMDFARHYGFGIHVCNPYSGNEKGRVERVGRDIRGFLCGKTFKDIAELNINFWEWLDKRNETIHRSTRKTPIELLKEERLIQLPQIEYSGGRTIPVLVSKTGFVEFETNKYSVPITSTCKNVSITAYPDRIVITCGRSRIAVHNRCFEKYKIIENPLHREQLLNRTVKYKGQRILQLMKSMDKSIAVFLSCAHERGENELDNSYRLFKLLKVCSRERIINCIKEICTVKSYKFKALLSLLKLPQYKENNPVYPRDNKLLDIHYETRRLEEYDGLI